MNTETTTSTATDLSNTVLVDGRVPLFHVVMDRNKFGLSESEADNQDMADEYAIVVDEKANAGIIVYGKYNDKWNANPWSTRFLIRLLLENMGVHISLAHIA